MSKSLKDKREALTHRTFLMMFRILVIFGIPAAIGFFIGRWIDQTYDIRPYGTLAVLLATFLFSWIITIRMYLNLTKEFRALDEEERHAKEKKQQELQKNLEDQL